MGYCIASVKIIGVGSLGLLSASLTYKSMQTIPLLISDLSKNIYSSSPSSASIKSYVNKVEELIVRSRFVNLVLGSVSSAMLALAFKSSPPGAKHPYLIYAALGAPLTIAGLYYKAYKYEQKLLGREIERLAIPATEEAKAIADEEISKDEVEKEEDDVVNVASDTESLGKSYVHVSDEESSSSTTSTPTSTAANSPKISAKPDTEQPSFSIEDEVESALAKKEFINDLENIKSSYIIGTAISGTTFLISLVGLIGDYYLL